MGSALVEPLAIASCYGHDRLISEPEFDGDRPIQIPRRRSVRTCGSRGPHRWVLTSQGAKKAFFVGLEGKWDFGRRSDRRAALW